MTVPGYGKPSAMGMNLYGAVQQAAPYAGHHSGAGAGAAGQGFAGPTFVNTQLDGVEVDDLHETGIDALREERMRSEEHTSELQSIMRTSYAVFCLDKKHT